MQSIFPPCAAAQQLLVCMLFLVASSTIASTISPLKLHGMNYNTRQVPDWDPNRCKNYTQIHRDLSVLSGLTTRIRILSLSDCQQGPLVVKAAKAVGLQVMLGLWVATDPQVFQTELALLQSMIQTKQVDVSSSSTTITGVTVGSEALYRKDVSLATLLDSWNQTKQVIPGLPVAICDVDDIYLQYPALFQNGDAVVINCKSSSVYCTI
jgi:glucan 1,3-beta-glucosidase